MHCFSNPAPGELLFLESGTTWPQALLATARPDNNAAGPDGPSPQADTSAAHHQRWMGCPALLPAARKDHKLPLATDRSVKKSLCVLCALCASVVKLLVVNL